MSAQPPPAPRIESGLSQVDVDGYGRRCFEAGRRFQRDRVDLRTREEVDLEISTALEPSRSAGRAEAIARMRELLDQLEQDATDDD